MKPLNFINFFRRSPKIEPSITKIEVDFSNINNQPEVIAPKIAPKSDDNRVYRFDGTEYEPDAPRNPSISLKQDDEYFSTTTIIPLDPNCKFYKEITTVKYTPANQSDFRALNGYSFGLKGTKHEVKKTNDPDEVSIHLPNIPNEVKEVKNKTSFLQKLRSCCTTNLNDVVDSSAKYKV